MLKATSFIRRKRSHASQVARHMDHKAVVPLAALMALVWP